MSNNRNIVVELVGERHLFRTHAVFRCLPNIYTVAIGPEWESALLQPKDSRFLPDGLYAALLLKFGAEISKQYESYAMPRRADYKLADGKIVDVE
jgi:hypothetical protein